MTFATLLSLLGFFSVFALSWGSEGATIAIAIGYSIDSDFRFIDDLLPISPLAPVRLYGPASFQAAMPSVTGSIDYVPILDDVNVSSCLTGVLNHADSLTQLVQLDFCVRSFELAALSMFAAVLSSDSPPSLIVCHDSAAYCRAAASASNVPWMLITAASFAADRPSGCPPLLLQSSTTVMPSFGAAMTAIAHHVATFGTLHRFVQEFGPLGGGDTNANANPPHVTIFITPLEAPRCVGDKPAPSTPSLSYSVPALSFWANDTFGPAVPLSADLDAFLGSAACSAGVVAVSLPSPLPYNDATARSLIFALQTISIDQRVPCLLFFRRTPNRHAPLEIASNFTAMVRAMTATSSSRVHFEELPDSPSDHAGPLVTLLSAEIVKGLLSCGSSEELNAAMATRTPIAIIAGPRGLRATASTLRIARAAIVLELPVRLREYQRRLSNGFSEGPQRSTLLRNLEALRVAHTTIGSPSRWLLLGSLEYLLTSPSRTASGLFRPSSSLDLSFEEGMAHLSLSGLMLFTAAACLGLFTIVVAMCHCICVECCPSLFSPARDPAPKPFPIHFTSPSKGMLSSSYLLGYSIMFSLTPAGVSRSTEPTKTPGWDNSEGQPRSGKATKKPK